MIQDVGRLCKAAHADAPDPPDAVRAALDAGAEFAQDGGCVEDVSGFEETLDGCFPHRKCTEDQGAV